MNTTEPSATEEARASGVEQAFTRLVNAEVAHAPCPPVRDLIGATDVKAAYAVQQMLIRRRLSQGAKVVGRKIGLTSPAVQRQLGVDRPDLGVLLEDMQVLAGRPIKLSSLLQPKVEAEVAFVLGEDLTTGDLNADRVRGAVAFASPAIEIVDSRISQWDITFADTVADNGSSALFAVGTAQRTLQQFEPVDALMSMSIDGKEVSSGSGSACLGDPLNALLWLAVTGRDLGDPLRRGEIILSGALGPMVPVTTPSTVRAEIEGLGDVTIEFIEGGSHD